MAGFRIGVFGAEAERVVGGEWADSSQRLGKGTVFVLGDHRAVGTAN